MIADIIEPAIGCRLEPVSPLNDRTKKKGSLDAALESCCFSR